MNDELKQAVASLRQAEQGAEAAGSASKAADQKVNDLKTQLAQAERDAASAKGSQESALKAVDDAKVLVSSKLKPGTPWTEDGKTVFMLGGDGKFRETNLGWVNGRPA